jgi:hypothetical protein
LRRFETKPFPPFDVPLEVDLVDGEVVVIGPGAVAFAMTVEAAMETARRLEALFEDYGSKGSDPD